MTRCHAPVERSAPTSARRSSRRCATSRRPSSPRTRSSGTSRSTSRARRSARPASSGSAASTCARTSAAPGSRRSDAVAIFEELAKGDPTIAAYISIHNMVAWMIDTYGDDEQRARVAAAPDRHADLGSYCLTEPGAGSDAAAITTCAIRDGDDYVLTGVKQFISGAGAAVRLRRHGAHRRARRPRHHRVPRSRRRRRACPSARTRRRWAGTRSPRAR